MTNATPGICTQMHSEPATLMPKEQVGCSTVFLDCPGMDAGGTAWEVIREIVPMPPPPED